MTSHVDQPAGCHRFGASCVVMDSSPLVRGEIGERWPPKYAAGMRQNSTSYTESKMEQDSKGFAFVKLCVLDKDVVQFQTFATLPPWT